MKMGFKIDGGAQLAKNLAQLSVGVQRGAMRQGLLAGAQPVKAAAEAHAPRGDPKAPNIATSIGISPSRTSLMGAVAVGPTRDVDYARYQEFGTIHHSAQPFMRPALDSAAPRVWPAVARALWGELLRRGIGSVRAGGTGGGAL